MCACKTEQGKQCIHQAELTVAHAHRPRVFCNTNCVSASPCIKTHAGDCASFTWGYKHLLKKFSSWRRRQFSGRHLKDPPKKQERFTSFYSLRIPCGSDKKKYRSPRTIAKKNVVEQVFINLKSKYSLIHWRADEYKCTRWLQVKLPVPVWFSEHDFTHFFRYSFESRNHTRFRKYS